MTTDTYSIQVAVDSTSAVTASRNLTAMEQATGRSERALSSLGSVAKIAGSALAGISIASLARDILKINIEFENMRAQLLSVTGSSVMAAKAMADIQKISRETPQSLQEITKSYMMLKNFGIEPTIQVMRDLTNITSKVGGDSDTLSGIIRQLGQAYAKNKLQAEDANSIIERGIPIYSLLSQVTGKTTSEVLKMMEAGKITRPVIEDLIHAMGSSAVDASANKMQTLGGKVDMLGEAWHNFEDVLLNDKASGILGNIVSGMIKSIDYLTERFGTSVGKQIADLEVSVAAAKKNIPENKNSASYAAANESYMQQQIMLDQLKRQKQLADAEASTTTEKIKNDKNIQKSQDETIRLRDLEIKRVKEFGTATQQENQALKEAKDTYGEVTASMKEQIHQKYFHKDITAAQTKLTKEESAAKKEAAKATKDLAEAERYFNEQLNAQVASAENAGKLFAAQQQTKIAALEAERVSISDKATIEYESAKTYEEKSRILNESQSATNLLLSKEKEIRDSLTNQSAETIDAKIAAAQAELDNAGKYNLTLAEQLRLKTEIAGLQTDKAVLAETSTQSDIKAKSDAEQKYNDDKLASIKAISDAQTAANTAASAQMDILTANLETAKEAATGLADAFGSVGGAVGGLGVALASYEKSQAAITDGLQNQLFEIQKLNDGKGDQAKADKAIATANQKQSQLQVKSYGDMTSAAQGFFKKGTAGYNALGVATKVFRAFEMAQSAMSMAKMVADIGTKVGAYVTGILTQTSANAASVGPNVTADGIKATAAGTEAVAKASAAPFPIGFATGAAMLAFMLAIGVSMAGGSGGAPTMTGAEYEQKQQDKYSASIKGSVLGSDQYSKSIVDSLDEIQSNSNADLDYSLGLLRSMEKLNNSMNALVAMTAKQLNIDIGQIQSGINFGTTKTSNSPLGSNDIVNFLAFGLLGGLFTKTTVKKEFAGAGIKFIDQTLGAIVTEGIKGAKTYVDVLVTTTKSSFFGMFKSVKQQIQTQYKALSEDVANSLTYTIVSMYDAISTASRLTGNADIIQKLKDTTISLGKVPLGKDSSKYEEILQATMSNLADSLAELDPRFKDFQKINEGYYQTLTRVSVGINTAQTKLKAMGINAIEYTKILEKQGDVEAEMVRQSLQLASAFTDVNDIIGKLPGTADDIIEAFKGLNSIKAGLSAIGASGLTLSQDLINVAGGISKFDSTLTDYIENYLTKTEQSAYKTGLLTDKFTQLGLVLPVMTSNAEESKTSYRKLLDVLKNDTSDTGRAIYATALGMASDFASAAEDYAAIVKERTDAIKATISTYEDYRIAIYKKLGEQNPVAKEEALRLEREKSMQGMDDLTRKYTTALNQLSDAGAELTSTTTALETAYKNLTAMRDKFVTLGQGLRTYYDQLMSVGKPQATPQEIYNAAKKSFQDTAAEAAKGTESALASLPEVSKAFLEASLKYNATGNAYQADYVSVLTALEKGMSAADRQIEIMNKQLAEAEKANVNLLGVKAKTTDVDNSIALLSTAVNNFSNAMANYTLQVAKVTAVDNTIKTEIQNKQTELNQIAADNTANLIKADEEKAARDKAAAEAVLAASEVARRETAAMNDPNYQGNYDEYVILEAAQAAAKAAAEAAVSVGKNSTDAQLDAIKATTSIAIESVAKISNAVIETNSAIQAMTDAANNKTYSFNNDAQSLVNLENIAVQAGYSGDYTDTYAMQSYLNSVGYKAYANGGMASGLSLVGEQGAELVNFTSPANVTSHQQTNGLFDSIGNAIDDQSVLLKEQIIELKALVNLQSSANVALINEMQGMKEELSTISRKAKLEAAA
jgi:tape measure domain-containing protein